MTIKRSLIALFAAAALALSVLAVVPSSEPEVFVAATASEPVPFQEAPASNPQEHRASAALRTTTTLPPTTTTQPPTTTTAEPPPPSTTAPPPVQDSNGGHGDPYDLASWYRLYECESAGLGWSVNTGNGYYGGLQFSLSSWQAVGGSGYPHEHSAEEQIRRGQMLWEQGGWAHWPACTAKFGWR